MKNKRITEFEKGQWSVIQTVIAFIKDYHTACELCNEVGFGRSKVLELEADSDTFMDDVKDFLEEKGHLLKD